MHKNIAITRNKMYNYKRIQRRWEMMNTIIKFVLRKNALEKIGNKS